MRLTLIREKKASSVADLDRPASAEVNRLFDRAMRLMNADQDDEAFEIFQSLAQRENVAPDILYASKTCRDVLDPARTPHEKAKTMMGFFQPTMIHLHFDKSSDLADEATMAETGDEALHQFEWMEQLGNARNQLFATAFELLESGKFKEADETFAELLARMDDYPTPVLRATVMLARQALNRPVVASEGPSDAFETIETVINRSSTEACRRELPTQRRPVLARRLTIPKGPFWNNSVSSIGMAAQPATERVRRRTLRNVDSPTTLSE